MLIPSFEFIASGATGEKARWLQELLQLNDFPVDIDGDFGAITEGELIRFQTARGLQPTGAVDAATFDALVRPISRAVMRIEPNGRSLGEMVVAYALQHLEERPCEIGGENAGPWVRLYMNGVDGPDQLWCAGFAISMYEQASDTLGIPMPFPRAVSCDELAANARERGLFVSESDRASGNPILAGSLFVLRKEPDDWFHTGVVLRAAASNIETIEGNTNEKGGNNGTAVFRRVRGYTDKDFISPGV